MNAPEGRAYWAVAPFSPAPPFEIYAGTEHKPFQATTRQIVRAARKGGDPQLDAIVAVKARPVLVITALPEPYDEVLALRLRTFDKLTDDEQEQVRGHRDDALFHLEPGRFPGLPAENAAIVTALLRLPISAIDSGDELGTLSESELRVVHERVARAHGLRLDTLVLAKAQELIEHFRVRGG